MTSNAANAGAKKAEPERQRKYSRAGLSLYATLDVPRTSTKQEIRKAYRKLALKYHPDKNNAPDAVNKFQEIQQAHAILTDDTRREIYDEYGSVGLQIAYRFGAENVRTFFLLQSGWCKVLGCLTFLLTGCCLCCCCCMCCNFCCGRYKPDPEYFNDYSNMQEGSPEKSPDASAAGAVPTVVETQPQASAAAAASSKPKDAEEVETTPLYHKTQKKSNYQTTYPASQSTTT